jgi:hypothetical protein
MSGFVDIIPTRGTKIAYWVVVCEKTAGSASVLNSIPDFLDKRIDAA